MPRKYFATVQAGDVAGVLALYDPDFYAVTPRAKCARLPAREVILVRRGLMDGSLLD
jgi:hypothetical protein